MNGRFVILLFVALACWPSQANSLMQGPEEGPEPDYPDYTHTPEPLPDFEPTQKPPYRYPCESYFHECVSSKPEKRVLQSEQEGVCVPYRLDPKSNLCFQGENEYYRVMCSTQLAPYGLKYDGHRKTERLCNPPYPFPPVIPAKRSTGRSRVVRQAFYPSHKYPSRQFGPSNFEPNFDPSFGGDFVPPDQIHTVRPPFNPTPPEIIPLPTRPPYIIPTEPPNTKPPYWPPVDDPHYYDPPVYWPNGVPPNGWPQGMFPPNFDQPYFFPPGYLPPYCVGPLNCWPPHCDPPKLMHFDCVPPGWSR